MIDSAFFILTAYAIFKGWRKGVIGALFSLLAFVVGIAAALKLSGTAASYLIEQAPSSAKWVPFLSFTLVFLLTALLLRMAGKVLETTFAAAGGGWINRAAGSVVYSFLYIIIFSVFVFFLIQLHLLGESSVNSSVSYPYIRNLPAEAMNALGKVIPWFKDTFTDLTGFFDQFPNKIKQK